MTRGEMLAPALLAQSILDASSRLALATDPAARRALDEATEQLAARDIGAAERALAGLLDVRERLARAVIDTLMGEALAAAIVRAADALPDPDAEDAA